MAKKQGSVLEKLEVLSKLFPQIFMANQEEYFSQVSDAFDDNPEKYLSRYKEMMAQIPTDTGGGNTKQIKKAEPKKSPTGLNKLPPETT